MAASSLSNFLKKSGGVAYYITSVFCVIGFILASRSNPYIVAKSVLSSLSRVSLPRDQGLGKFSARVGFAEPG
jgi:hypothetical protein